MSNYKKVFEFHEESGSYIGSTPKIPNENVIELRLKLINEELKELTEAINANDIIESADAIADLLYVVYGTAVSFGINIDKTFDEVHSSNMSKFCDTEDLASRTVEHYKTIGVDTYYKKLNNVWVVYRSSDNKILKSINYRPANIKEHL